MRMVFFRRFYPRISPEMLSNILYKSRVIIRITSIAREMARETETNIAQVNSKQIIIVVGLPKTNNGRIQRRKYVEHNKNFTIVPKYCRGCHTF